MDLLIILAVIFIAFIFVLRVRHASTSEKRKVFKNNVYSYSAKQLPMTATEAAFFVKLDKAVSDRYYTFPQVHLSALLDYRIKGQDWNFAFRHINGKSVDYVLCDKNTLRPTYVIELDDYTHGHPDRQERDREIERIFDEADIPLVRFSDKNVSENDIIQALIDAKS